MTEEIDYLPFDNTTLQKHRRIVEQYGGIQNLLNDKEIAEFIEYEKWLEEYDAISEKLEKSEAKRQGKINSQSKI